MKLLALDASTEFLSLALCIGDNVHTHDQHAGQTASQLILPQIKILLDAASLALTDLDGIAFGAGPGSFTGVRIACGVAQGLGYGANLPVVGISALMALAQASGEGKVIACTDARMGEVYHAVFEKQESGWLEVQAAGVYKPDAVPVVEGNDWAAVGSGWLTYDEILSQQYQNKLSKKLPNITPMAEAIAQLAMPTFAAGLAKPASEAAPVYIRNRVALTTQERAQGMRL